MKLKQKIKQLFCNHKNLIFDWHWEISKNLKTLNPICTVRVICENCWKQMETDIGSEVIDSIYFKAMEIQKRNSWLEPKGSSHSKVTQN